MACDSDCVHKRCPIASILQQKPSLLYAFLFLILDTPRTEAYHRISKEPHLPPTPASAPQGPAVPVAHAVATPIFLQRVCGCLAGGLTHILPCYETEKQKTQERIRKPTGDLGFFLSPFFPFVSIHDQGSPRRPLRIPLDTRSTSTREQNQCTAEYLQDTVRHAGIRYGLMRCITGIDHPQTQTRSSFACLRCKFTVAVS